MSRVQELRAQYLITFGISHLRATTVGVTVLEGFDNSFWGNVRFVFLENFQCGSRFFGTEWRVEVNVGDLRW